MQAETVLMDTMGRIVIPATLRAALNLEPQSQLEIQLQDGALLLSPRPQGRVELQDGILVWLGADVPESLEELIATARAEPRTSQPHHSRAAVSPRSSTAR